MSCEPPGRRIQPPLGDERSTPPGGLALGVLAAMRSRGGFWFGWSGEIVEREPDEPRLIIRDNVTFGTVDMTADDYDVTTWVSATARYGRCFTISWTA